ncbi:hypothetical protein BVRB_4g095770 [Beta vulgaris subsp. vulgaris]|uniref:Uncharacterized protein n=1 Tax=Beta vulgaris subsp. vulgaris TaxID=3555 RepID=A0A0J8BDG6_BETVV|nr:hypothetical protein BVRB_4g095770 [Beta vulgaris subsp. vulgaris]
MISALSKQPCVSRSKCPQNYVNNKQARGVSLSYSVFVWIICATSSIFLELFNSI